MFHIKIIFIFFYIPSKDKPVCSTGCIAKLDALVAHG